MTDIKHSSKWYVGYGNGQPIKGNLSYQQAVVFMAAHCKDLNVSMFPMSNLQERTNRHG